MLRNKRKDIWTVLTGIVFLLYILFLVFPLFSLLKSSFQPNGQTFSLDYFKTFFTEPYYYSTLFNSLKVTIAVTLLTLVIAFPLAYIMTTFKIKGSVGAQILILISSMSPPFIGAYSWILLFGRSGVVTKLLRSAGIEGIDIYGFKGILIVLTLQLVPLIYMYLMGALKNIDQSLLEASENLGSTGLKRIFKVIIPLVLPTMLGGALLVFMRALADFGTPMLIGEGFQTIPVIVYNQFIGEMGGDSGFAAAISVIIIVFAVAIFLVQKVVTEKKSFSMSALNPIQKKEHSKGQNAAAHIFVYLYLAISVLPLLYVVYTAFLKTSGKIFVKGYSLDNFRKAFSRLGGSISTTFILAIISLAIILVIGVIVAYVTVKRKNKVTEGLDILAMLPYIAPGSVMGIALLIAFSKKPLILSGTAIIMIVAYVIRRSPYTIRSSAATLYQISPSIEEASESLGASSGKTFWRIILPMMKSGIISGAILSWISIISELSTSILLHTARTKTMTVGIYTEVLRGNYGTAAALATILILLTTISLFIFFKVTGKKEITM